MDWRVFFTILLSYLQTLIWPGLLGLLAWLFRSQVRALLSSVESAKGWGVEATFLKQAITDPRNSDETKDEVARILRDIAVTRGGEVPAQASEQLAKSERLRGKPAGPSVVSIVEAENYEEQVSQAVRRVGGDKFTPIAPSGFAYTDHDGQIKYAQPAYAFAPTHGIGSIRVFAIFDPADPKLDALETLKDPALLVVAPSQQAVTSHPVTCWASQDDDDSLADALEAIGAFDYLESGERRPVPGGYRSV